ncbi:hypothetical protein F5888DRAFT_1893412 [Russula emetica]|nr:hypothetical protein F5888DRAFT_1893412 [Russula emetica]
MANYYGANEHPPLHEHRPHVINNHAGVALDFPPEAQAAAPAPPEEIVVVDNPARHPVTRPGLAQAFFDERPDQGPVPNGPAAEILRQFAIVYLYEPHSQVAMINMEHGHSHGVRIVITLDLATR